MKMKILQNIFFDIEEIHLPELNVEVLNVSVHEFV